MKSKWGGNHCDLFGYILLWSSQVGTGKNNSVVIPKKNIQFRSLQNTRQEC